MQCVLGRGRDNPEFIETSESTETLNVTSLVGKEPELLHDINRYQLDIVCSERQRVGQVSPQLAAS